LLLTFWFDAVYRWQVVSLLGFREFSPETFCGKNSWTFGGKNNSHDEFYDITQLLPTGLICMLLDYGNPAHTKSKAYYSEQKEVENLQ
jgi:hypothetical protein